LTLALMISSLLGFTLGVSQAQATTDQLALVGQTGAAARQMPTREPGTPGPCGGEMTVSRVTNRTITVTGPNGNTETVYVTAHTQYTQYGHAVSVSAVQVGSKIYVVGSCANQGGRINATSIEIVG
jgi:pectate lyase